MKTEERRDAVLRTLQRSGKRTINELADQFRVSRRTILRDIGTMRERGYLVETDTGHGGGVRLDPASINRHSPLSVAEIFAMIISVHAMKTAKTLPFSKLADQGLAKLESLLKRPQVYALRTLLDRLHFGTLPDEIGTGEFGELDDDLIPTFEVAFMNNNTLSFAYCDANDVNTRRTVEPQAVLILPPLWYLVAWDPMRNDFRHFRMDRIADPIVNPMAHFIARRVPFEQDVCPYQAAH